MVRAQVGDSDRPSGHGPAIGAVTLWKSSGGTRAQLLSDEERAQLALIASVVRFKKSALIYLQTEASASQLSYLPTTCSGWPRKENMLIRQRR